MPSRDWLSKSLQQITCAHERVLKRPKRNLTAWLAQDGFWLNSRRRRQSSSDDDYNHKQQQLKETSEIKLLYIPLSTTKTSSLRSRILLMLQSTIWRHRSATILVDKEPQLRRHHRQRKGQISWSNGSQAPSAFSHSTLVTPRRRSTGAPLLLPASASDGSVTSESLSTFSWHALCT